MQQWYIEYNKERKFSPMSWWVHKAIGKTTSEKKWKDSKHFEPEFPKKLVARGFPYLVVPISGFELQFSSSHEIRHCIEILEQKILPRIKNLNENRNTYPGYNHWLATYPSVLKPWVTRRKTVKVLKNILKDLVEMSIDF